MTDVRSLSAGHGLGAAAKVAIGFAAGFLAVLAFHQATIGMLYAVGVLPRPPFLMLPTAPFGVPLVFSLAFWGGVWGIAFAAVEPRLPRGGAYWLAAIVFGALGPTLVGWFVVAPLKGLPVGYGFQLSRLWIGFLVNGAWGLGTALLFRGGLGLVGRHG